MSNRRISNELLYEEIQSISKKMDAVVPLLATHSEAIDNNKKQIEKLDVRFWGVVAAIAAAVITKITRLW